MNRPSSRGITQAVLALVVVAVLVIIGVLVFGSSSPSPSPSASHTAPPAAAGFRLIRHLAYGSSPYQYMDIIMPAHPDHPLPVVMFVHGGGFVKSGNSALYPEARAVAKIGWVGISVNYRVSGYPYESDDVLSAAAWVHAHAAQYHFNADKIALFGTSAGGNLVAQAATIAHQQHRNLGVAAVVSWSGPMNFVSFAHAVSNNPHLLSIADRYLGCSLAKCPSTWSAASPISHVTAGDPPMFLANSTNEVVPYSQATEMVSKLQATGDTAHLLTLSGTTHALAYAPRAFQPSINWLTQYLGPLSGTLPAVTN